jgi:hypothetical protein
MLRVLAIVAVAVVLTGCAGFQPAGRNAERSEAPAALPPPAAHNAVNPPAENPPPPTLPAPSVAAPSVSASAPPPPPSNDNSDVTVVAPTERQVPPPSGDPRSVAERREDIQRWDHCVMQVQSSADSDPMRPTLDTPEDVCSRQLGQANRTAVPESRLAPHH